MARSLLLARLARASRLARETRTARRSAKFHAGRVEPQALPTVVLIEQHWPEVAEAKPVIRVSHLPAFDAAIPA